LNDFERWQHAGESAGCRFEIGSQAGPDSRIPGYIQTAQGKHTALIQKRADK
jgi:hypothetical protein